MCSNMFLHFGALSQLTSVMNAFRSPWRTWGDYDVTHLSTAVLNMRLARIKSDLHVLQGLYEHTVNSSKQDMSDRTLQEMKQAVLGFVGSQAQEQQEILRRGLRDALELKQVVQVVANKKQLQQEQVQKLITASGNWSAKVASINKDMKVCAADLNKFANKLMKEMKAIHTPSNKRTSQNKKKQSKNRSGRKKAKLRKSKTKRKSRKQKKQRKNKSRTIKTNAEELREIVGESTRMMHDIYNTNRRHRFSVVSSFAHRERALAVRLMDRVTKRHILPWEVKWDILKVKTVNMTTSLSELHFKTDVHVSAMINKTKKRSRKNRKLLHNVLQTIQSLKDISTKTSTYDTSSIQQGDFSLQNLQNLQGPLQDRLGTLRSDVTKSRDISQYLIQDKLYLDGVVLRKLHQAQLVQRTLGENTPIGDTQSWINNIQTIESLHQRLPSVVWDINKSIWEAASVLRCRSIHDLTRRILKSPDTKKPGEDDFTKNSQGPDREDYSGEEVDDSFTSDKHSFTYEQTTRDTNSRKPDKPRSYTIYPTTMSQDRTASMSQSTPEYDEYDYDDGGEAEHAFPNWFAPRTFSPESSTVSESINRFMETAKARRPPIFLTTQDMKHVQSVAPTMETIYESTEQTKRKKKFRSTTPTTTFSTDMIDNDEYDDVFELPAWMIPKTIKDATPTIQTTTIYKRKRNRKPKTKTLARIPTIPSLITEKNTKMTHHVTPQSIQTTTDMAVTDYDDYEEYVPELPDWLKPKTKKHSKQTTALPRIPPKNKKKRFTTVKPTTLLTDMVDYDEYGVSDDVFALPAWMIPKTVKDQTPTIQTTTIYKRKRNRKPKTKTLTRIPTIPSLITAKKTKMIHYATPQSIQTTTDMAVTDYDDYEEYVPELPDWLKPKTIKHYKQTTALPKIPPKNKKKRFTTVKPTTLLTDMVDYDEYGVSDDVFALPAWMIPKTVKDQTPTIQTTTIYKRKRNRKPKTNTPARIPTIPSLITVKKTKMIHHATPQSMQTTTDMAVTDYDDYEYFVPELPDWLKPKTPKGQQSIQVTTVLPRKTKMFKKTTLTPLTLSSDEDLTDRDENYDDYEILLPAWMNPPEITYTTPFKPDKKKKKKNKRKNKKQKPHLSHTTMAPLIKTGDNSDSPDTSLVTYHQTRKASRPTGEPADPWPTLPGMETTLDMDYYNVEDNYAITLPSWLQPKDEVTLANNDLDSIDTAVPTTWGPPTWPPPPKWGDKRRRKRSILVDVRDSPGHRTNIDAGQREAFNAINMFSSEEIYQSPIVVTDDPVIDFSRDGLMDVERERRSVFESMVPECLNIKAKYFEVSQLLGRVHSRIDAFRTKEDSLMNTLNRQNDRMSFLTVQISNTSQALHSTRHGMDTMWEGSIDVRKTMVQHDRDFGLKKSKNIELRVMRLKALSDRHMNRVKDVLHGFVTSGNVNNTDAVLQDFYRLRNNVYEKTADMRRHHSQIQEIRANLHMTLDSIDTLKSYIRPMVAVLQHPVTLDDVYTLQHGSFVTSPDSPVSDIRFTFKYTTHDMSLLTIGQSEQIEFHLVRGRLEARYYTSESHVTLQSTKYLRPLTLYRVQLRCIDSFLDLVIHNTRTFRVESMTSQKLGRPYLLSNSVQTVKFGTDRRQFQDHGCLSSLRIGGYPVLLWRGLSRDQNTPRPCSSENSHNALLRAKPSLTATAENQRYIALGRNDLAAHNVLRIAMDGDFHIDDLMKFNQGHSSVLEITALDATRLRLVHRTDRGSMVKVCKYQQTRQGQVVLVITSRRNRLSVYVNSAWCFSTQEDFLTDRTLQLAIPSMQWRHLASVKVNSRYVYLRERLY